MQRLLIDLGQIAFALIVSAVVAVLVGPTYLAVAALVTATSVVLLYEAAQRAVIDEPIDFKEVLLIAGSSVIFGIIWPSIPVILTLRRVGEPLVGDE